MRPESGDQAKVSCVLASACGSEPSTRATVSTPSFTKATCVQSGERSPAGMPGTKRSGPWGTAAAQTPVSFARFRPNTICVPCGDHCGQQSPGGGT